MKFVLVLSVCAHLAFAANPNYSYHVKIDDAAEANFQEKAETRKGEYAQGFYSVLDPNGSLRTVTYTADEWGFNPTITYSYPGLSVYSSAGRGPALVTDQRVALVDKTGVRPELPKLSISNPVRVATPVKVVGVAAGPVKYAPAPIYQTYAPAYTPAYAPAPRPAIALTPAYAPAPRPAIALTPAYAPAPRPAIALAPAYLPPPPAPLVVSKPVAVARPPQVLISRPPPVAVVEDSYSVPPRNTVTDPNAQVYPDAVKVVNVPARDYGPPNYVAPPPLATVAVAPVKQVVPLAPVKQFVAVAPPPKIAYAVPQAVATPVLSAYANAIGYNTYSGSANAYGLSYGTQGFQVTSSRKFNKGLISVAPVVQKQVVATAPVLQQTYAPQVQYVQPPPAPVYQTVQSIAPVRVVNYAPPPAPVVQYAPAPAPVVKYAPPPAPVVQYGPPPAPVVQYGPPPPQRVVVQQAAPARLLAPAGPVAIAGKKQNPLTFAYGYSQGGATVSHSYSGSGW